MASLTEKKNMDVQVQKKLRTRYLSMKTTHGFTGNISSTVAQQTILYIYKWNGQICASVRIKHPLFAVNRSVQLWEMAFVYINEGPKRRQAINPGSSVRALTMKDENMNRNNEWRALLDGWFPIQWNAA
jgi:hypothetical protein